MAFAIPFSRHKNPNHQKVLSINTAVQGTQGNEPENEIDVTAYAVPGICEIRCIPKNRVYIGESENLLARLGKHAASLAQKQHDCTDLQQDWNQFGLKGHSFRILRHGPSWADGEKRRNEEALILKEEQKESFSVYNTDRIATFTHNYRRLIEIDGKVYASVIAAQKGVGVSETTIQRRLRDSKYPTWRELDRIKSGYTKVCIEGQEFKSIEAVVKAGLANNRGTVTRRLNSSGPKWRKSLVEELGKVR
uniref:Putative GIY-YIG homing endonuclease n=1 Tax=Paradoxia multiseta TaxID=249350 RepID=A0A097KP45_9CHLO|nr:putative GIY-YIG homing endonuclease [Paradoxia multiseta]AIT94984.1 putative GIY-YIG homing endonuclease [Paradoxia multiseta]